MASTTNFVVVWEWMNEFGRWRPYEPHITNFIEKNHQLKPTNQINLGMIDSSLAMYSIDFLTMCQVRFGTGTARPIRKRLYPDTSPPGKGIVWQWEGDVAGQWHTYDMQVACIIEDHFSKNTASPGILDLSKSAVKLPYILDLNNMSQKRIETGRVRNLRREILTVSYPMIAANQQGISGNVGVSGNGNINVPSGGSLLSNMASQSKQNPIQSVSTNNIASVNTNNVIYSGAKKMKISHNSSAQTISSASQQNFPLMSSAAINQSNSNVCHTSALQNSNISGNGPLTRKRLNIYLSSQNQNLQGQPSSQNTHLFGSNLPSQPLAIPSSQMPGSMYTVSSNQMPIQSSYHSMQATPSSGGHAQNHSLSNVNSLHPQSSSNNLMPPGTMIPPGTIMPPTTLQYLNQGGPMPPRFMFVSGGSPHMSMSQIPGHQIGLQPSVPGGGSGQAYPGSLPVPGKLFSKSKGASRISPVVTTATNVLMSPAVPMLLPSTSASGGSNLPREDRIPNNVPKNSKKDSGKSSSCDIFEKYVTIIGDPPDEEDCCICCEKLSHHSGYGEDQQDSKIVFKLCKCNHMFHKLCIQAMYESGAKNGCVQCPTCKAIYGEKHGNCPRGVMEYHWMPQSLPGNEDCQTIRIVYHVSQGIQGTEHPHPGKRFSARGFPRVCYLPDNMKGRKVLKLLIVAWKRRLTFTIGTSTTTGESDTVTWNEIHHKTEFGTNYSGHGYPDDKYLDNVLMELGVHGVTESDL